MVTQSKMREIGQKWKTEISQILPESRKTKGADPFLKQLQDLCREVKGQKNLTLQDISDASGIPLSTVNNFFSASSRLPSIGTAGPICQVLGVSMDSYYGIAPSEQELQTEADTLRLQLHDLELENVRLTERIRVIEQMQAGNRRNTLLMLAVNTVLTIALFAYLVIDANIRTEGLIIHGQPSVLAYILMALTALSVVVIVIGAIRAIRRK